MLKSFEYLKKQLTHGEELGEEGEGEAVTADESRPRHGRAIALRPFIFYGSLERKPWVQEGHQGRHHINTLFAQAMIY